ncbi:MAG: hypothetical protein J0H68_01375 [Sphingobacteriia bacterium]|nr:hypothetical protein [Sphingobacteriia bacterium]
MKTQETLNLELKAAIDNGNEEQCLNLIAQIEDINNFRDEKGNTFLHLLIESYNQNKFKKYTQTYRKRSYRDYFLGIDSSAFSGQITILTSYEPLEVLKALISKGSEINAKNNLSKTPIKLLFESSEYPKEMAITLLNKGADIRGIDESNINIHLLKCLYFVAYKILEIGESTNNDTSADVYLFERERLKPLHTFWKTHFSNLPRNLKEQAIPLLSKIISLNDDRKIDLLCQIAIKLNDVGEFNAIELAYHVVNGTYKQAKLNLNSIFRDLFKDLPLELQTHISSYNFSNPEFTSKIIFDTYREQIMEVRNNTTSTQSINFRE